MSDDYEQYAMYRQAMAAFDDPGFARWLCRAYPWGGADLARAREGYLLARDGLQLSGTDVGILLSVLVPQLAEAERRARDEPVFAETAKRLRELVLGLRRVRYGHDRRESRFALRCACDPGDEDAPLSRHDEGQPGEGENPVLDLDGMARQITQGPACAPEPDPHIPV